MELKVEPRHQWHSNAAGTISINLSIGRSSVFTKQHQTLQCEGCCSTIRRSSLNAVHMQRLGRSACCVLPPAGAAPAQPTSRLVQAPAAPANISPGAVLLGADGCSAYAQQDTKRSHDAVLLCGDKLHGATYSDAHHEMHMHRLDALSMQVMNVASLACIWRGCEVRCMLCVAGTGIALQGGVVQHRAMQWRTNCGAVQHT
jgi:hypothetical protein